MYNMSKLRSAMQKGKRSTLTMAETTKTPRKRTKEAVKKGSLIMLRLLIEEIVGVVSCRITTVI
jgi:hypothetical protein